MILLLLSALCDLSRDPGLPPERPLAQDVRLELTTGRRTYVVGEPVKFRLTARNTSKFCVYAGLMIHPRTDFLHVRLRYDGSDEHVLQLTPPRNPRPGEPRVLAYPVTLYRRLEPNEAVSEEEQYALDWARDAFILDKPGRYEFSARYLEPHGGSEPVLESNVWDVEVEPPPDRHRDAYEAYTKELARFTAWPLHEQPTAEIIDKAFDFVERFPESPWTNPLRRMALAFMKWENITPFQRERWERLCESDPPREIGDAPSPCPQRR